MSKWLRIEAVILTKREARILHRTLTRFVPIMQQNGLRADDLSRIKQIRTKIGQGL